MDVNVNGNGNGKSLERMVSLKALQMGNSFSCQICVIGFLCGVCLTSLFLAALTSFDFAAAPNSTSYLISQCIHGSRMRFKSASSRKNVGITKHSCGPSPRPNQLNLLGLECNVEQVKHR